MSHSMVLLVRPIFTLQGASPTVDAVSPVQNRWRLLVVVAFAAAVARVIVERIAESRAVRRAVAEASRQMLRHSARSRLPAPVGWAVGAMAGTLVLSALVSHLWQAAATFVVLLVLAWTRDRLRRSGRPEALAHVPLLARVAFVMPASYVVTRFILGFAATSGRWTTDSFVTPWVAVLTCAVLATLVLAPSPAAARPGPAS